MLVFVMEAGEKFKIGSAEVQVYRLGRHKLRVVVDDPDKMPVERPGAKKKPPQPEDKPRDDSHT